MAQNHIGMMIALTEKDYDESTRVTDRMIYFYAFIYLLTSVRKRNIIYTYFRMVSSLSQRNDKVTTCPTIINYRLARFNLRKRVCP
jgi:hypothetical protein